MNFCVKKGVFCQSQACYNCTLPDVGYYPYTYLQNTIPVPKKRIIEKFDDKGNLVERITEEG